MLLIMYYSATLTITGAMFVAIKSAMKTTIKTFDDIYNSSLL